MAVPNSNTKTIDFHYEDFNGNDFSIRKRVGKTLTDFFFSFLPAYYKINDTYKDGEGRGLLQRYLSAFDPVVLDVVFPNIENYLDITDAQTCNPKYLVHIADALGNPPDVFGDDNKYRNLLSYIVTVYKIKGSIASYKLFFDILGFYSEIDEIPLLNKTSLYDNGGEYDSDEFLSEYDRNLCQTCSYYDITLYYKDIDNYNIDQTIINNIREAIKFNEPINARLRNLTIGIRLRDSMDIEILDNDITTEYIIPPIYDDGNEYDDGLLYEQP